MNIHSMIQAGNLDEHIRKMPRTSPDTLTPASVSPGLANLGKVTLDVGGRKFTTLISTLEESEFLKTLVSDRWGHNRQADGSYFVDANSDIFEDVLEYLRRGWMPLFWDRDTGHDFSRYKKLQQESEYLGISRLERWLKESRFLEAVLIVNKITNKVILDQQQVEIASSTPGSRQRLKTDWVEIPMYLCDADPRMGRYHSRLDDCPGLCGKACNDKRRNEWVGANLPQQSCRVMQATLVEDIVKFNAEVCRPN